MTTRYRSSLLLQPNQIFGIGENFPGMRQRERDNDRSFRSRTSISFLFLRSGLESGHARSLVESFNPSLETSQSQRDNLL